MLSRQVPARIWVRRKRSLSPPEMSWPASIWSSVELAAEFRPMAQERRAHVGRPDRPDVGILETIMGDEAPFSAAPCSECSHSSRIRGALGALVSDHQHGTPMPVVVP
jgi:hypothetical protein